VTAGGLTSSEAQARLAECRHVQRRLILVITMLCEERESNPHGFTHQIPSAKMEGTKGYAEGTPKGIFGPVTDGRVREMDTISIAALG